MKNLSRRSFLKGSVAMGALAAMGGASLASAEETYTYADTIKWDAQYDVVVLGMGFAGMNAAMTAADAGASVVICEKMNDALSGGNSKVCGQLFAYGNEDYEATLKYYKQLSGGRDVPDDMLETIVKGVTHMWGTIKDKFYEGDTSVFLPCTGVPMLGYMSPEYPEFEGSDKVALVGTNQLGGVKLYDAVRATLLKYKDKLDVWFETPAIELIQEPTTKTIIGVKVNRKGEVRNVRALNGVVVATGGFECNKDMVQQYLNVINYGARGGQYNTGDGIKMCQQVGAELWHMNAFEGLFGLGGVTWPQEPGTGSCEWLSVLTQNALNTGAAILVGTDGHRFLNESEVVRHGHLYENGVWENPAFSEHTWYIFDETQKALIDEAGLISEKEQETVLAFNTLEELAAGTGCKDIAETIENFNSFAANGKDYTCGRAAEFMRPFDGKKYYAKYVYQGLLNTQGGPKRNVNAEILDVNGNAIPHLYSAGEMGGITACMYQGGTNVAECIIFGEIAGKNAAAPKEALPAYTAAAKGESNPITMGMENDLGAEKNYETTDGQYVGVGKGLMGDVVVRITVADGKITAAEVIEQNETATIAGPALEKLPGLFVGCATAEEIDAIDSVSGATVTSGALKEAVKNALAQVK